MWSLLWLTGASQYTHDVSLLNIDAFRMGPCFDDQPSVYFQHYNMAFRRILKVIHFLSYFNLIYSALLYSAAKAYNTISIHPSNHSSPTLF